MKNQKHQLLSIFALTTFSLILVTTACKKSNSGPGDPGPFSASFNGVAYEPTKVVGFAQLGYVNIQSYQVKSGDTISLQLSIPDTTSLSAIATFKTISLKYFNIADNRDKRVYFKGDRSGRRISYSYEKSRSQA